MYAVSDDDKTPCCGGSETSLPTTRANRCRCGSTVSHVSGKILASVHLARFDARHPKPNPQVLWLVAFGRGTLQPGELAQAAFGFGRAFLASKVGPLQAVV